ncbi:hypothetical protein P170DRAFT_480792 [Aspergillus steynii IBT 23096]|uniref:Uncharacterized protein n=1 Tax=Aspergillus steynii IBT 23096 TaxID=1392250 RepID=A0A2I2FT70_9EURO|nr:uncharacterized protein P170DRAFT_480792 [Aspergillus steynii IBT 23096]PLB43843.1 hypothetical protein P170DRAFT_480792 [Aspergillus steynii IBT 23096]
MGNSREAGPGDEGHSLSPSLLQVPSPDHQHHDRHDSGNPCSHQSGLSDQDYVMLNDIPMLRDQSDLYNWLRYVETELDFWGRSHFIDPQTPRPQDTETPSYLRWRDQALSVSNWLRMHISEELVRELKLPSESDMPYPADLILTLSEHLSPGPTVLATQAYELPRRGDYTDRSHYINAIRDLYRQNSHLAFPILKITMMVLDILEPEIPLAVSVQRENVKKYDLMNTVRCMTLLDQLSAADE